MTEAEWLDCTDPGPMLSSLLGKVSDRRLRLFVAGCCRRVWEHLTDPKARKALELVERAADGSDIRMKLGRAAVALGEIMYLLERRHGEFGYVYDYQWFPTEAVLSLLDPREPGRLAPTTRIGSVPYLITRFVRETSISEYRERDEMAEETALSNLLRDVCGNPFQSVSMDPSWQSSIAVALARSIYEDQAFDRLPILADALEDAGCDEPAVLAHCRSDSPHVRGCWAVDRVLGKE